MCPVERLTTPERPRTKTRLKGVAPHEPPPPEQGTPAQIGRYEVLEVVGHGAMGVVYKARDPLLDRIVAVKTIHAPTSLGKSVRKAFHERFDREAKAAARISHPAIVTIFDVGREGDVPFLVMEYLPGETLADRLDRARVPLGPAVQCARELASALGFAHRERIVHRDVKPANVLHAGDNRWKLADFGIARLPDSDLTQIGIFMGTPGYAPPEAIRDGRYTVQADVFAWGAVFYELISGRVPYEGPDTQTTNSYVLRAEPPSPETFDPALPAPLAQVALRALAHDPKKRYANGAEAEAALAEAWERSLASGLVPVSAFASAPAPAPAVSAAGSTSPARVEPQVCRADAPTVLDLHAAARAQAAEQGRTAPEGVRAIGEPEVTSRAPTQERDPAAPRPISRTAVRPALRGIAPGVVIAAVLAAAAVVAVGLVWLIRS
jgi:serine/threonine-protein kinase